MDCLLCYDWQEPGLDTPATGKDQLHCYECTQVPAETVSALKRLARSHDRSLQGELRAIPERAGRMAPPDDDVGALNLVTVRVGSRGSWSREEIYGADGR